MFQVFQHAAHPVDERLLSTRSAVAAVIGRVDLVAPLREVFGQQCVASRMFCIAVRQENDRLDRAALRFPHAIEDITCLLATERGFGCFHGYSSSVSS